jgi:Winged helix DNA-binding domain
MSVNKMKKQITNLRLANQQITVHDFDNIKDLVGWMGALQAQDYGMSKWAVGLRVRDTTEKEVEGALDRGDIIRTHVLRPTWHLARAEDIRWMTELTAPEVRKLLSSRLKIIGLDSKTITAATKVLEKIFKKNDHYTRDEVKSYLGKSKVQLDNDQFNHVIISAELNMLLCSGARRGKQSTYALFDRRIAATKAIHREEALARLARIYFFSRGPATVQDFEWWSGLLLRDARAGLESIRSDLSSFLFDSREYWFKESGGAKGKDASVFLLPAFDEYTIGYADRTAVLDKELSKAAMTVNGIFFPLMVLNGKGIGIWKRRDDGKRVLIKSAAELSETAFKKLSVAAKKYGRFLGKPVEVDGE